MELKAPVFITALIYSVHAWSVEGFSQERSELEQRGKVLAEKHCARCHVVDSDKPFTGISSTPSFKLLVNALNNWEDRFASFYARLPHQSIVRFENDEVDPDIQELRPPVILALEDVDALVEFARTLKD